MPLFQEVHRAIRERRAQIQIHVYPQQPRSDPQGYEAGQSDRMVQPIVRGSRMNFNIMTFFAIAILVLAWILRR
jgi:hypothetical protein